MNELFGLSPLRWLEPTSDVPGHYARVASFDQWALEHGITASERVAMRKDAAGDARMELEAQDLAE